MQPDALVRLTEVLISVGVTIQAIEVLVARRLYAYDGLYAWNILSTNTRWMSVGWRAGLLRPLLEYNGLLVLISIQLGAALLLLSGAWPQWRLAMVAVMLAVHMLYLLRNQYGLDGSDQMMTIVLAALAAYLLHSTGFMLAIVFTFVAAQLVLSYFTAGWAKAISKSWRSGAAIGGILGTSSYGSRAMSRFFLDHQWAAQAICWSVILYECGGPLLPWIHPHAALLFIAVGVLFHLSIASFMGLNIFFWSFISAFPAVYFCAGYFSLLGTRSGPPALPLPF